MDYTLEELKYFAATPEADKRWGDGAVTVRSLLSRVYDASCTTCQYRRLFGDLQYALQQYGDGLVGRPAYRTRQESRRSACLECVKKHVAEAFVLSAEWVAGYVDYTSLVEAHLSQALEECPADMPLLMSLLRASLRQTASENRPVVLYEAIMDQIPRAEVRKTDKSLQKNTQEPEKYLELPENHRISGPLDRQLLELTLKCLDMASETGVSEVWEGYMAVAADAIHGMDPLISRCLRARRLLYGGCFEGFSDPNIPYSDNKDVIYLLKNALKGV